MISVASTMVLTRLLIDRGELNMEHGRVMVAITLVEDLAVVILIVLLPNFDRLDSARLLILGKSLGKAAPHPRSRSAARGKILPPVLRAVARTRSPELFLASCSRLASAPQHLPAVDCRLRLVHLSLAS